MQKCKLKWIRDTGIGIPERSSRLFQAFRQADASIPAVAGGAGWAGDYTKLVNEMGGDISFHSQLNRGSTFWFHINLDLNPNIIEGPSAVRAGKLNVEPELRSGCAWIFK